MEGEYREDPGRLLDEDQARSGIGRRDQGKREGQLEESQKGVERLIIRAS